ncbi:ABC transporter ATP-binding protein [Bifidobacterium moukalabense]|uniref:ABC transporter ATP-binding protein n=1 Tax=Bifidobacterium moukalabense TaxID=1333651 RepID=UPI0010F62A11|nr:ABC transporter ATP-binding protein [Bifidobacterium moukalabense]
MSDTAKISVQNVSQSFGELSVLERIDLDFRPNEFVAVVGASGCGKSTLLSIIGGLLEPTEGQVFVDGRPIAGPGRDRGIIFQKPTLLPWMSCQKNVEFVLQQDRTLSKTQRAEIARQRLADVKLSGFEDAYPNELSGGMQQRLVLARSLAYKPEILLMDEPFGALDALTRQEMQLLLAQVWEANRMTVMMVTHDIDEAVFTADRVIVVSPRPGRILEEVHIDLPRPRRQEMIATEAFQQYSSRIWNLIHQQR